MQTLLQFAIIIVFALGFGPTTADLKLTNNVQQLGNNKKRQIQINESDKSTTEDTGVNKLHGKNQSQSRIENLIANEGVETKIEKVWKSVRNNSHNVCKRSNIETPKQNSEEELANTIGKKQDKTIETNSKSNTVNKESSRIEKGGNVGSAVNIIKNKDPNIQGKINKTYANIIRKSAKQNTKNAIADAKRRTYLRNQLGYGQYRPYSSPYNIHFANGTYNITIAKTDYKGDDKTLKELLATNAAMDTILQHEFIKYYAIQKAFLDNTDKNKTARFRRDFKKHTDVLLSMGVSLPGLTKPLRKSKFRHKKKKGRRKRRRN